MAACTVCAHRLVEEIDAALVAGEGRRSIAKRFEVGEASVQRHRTSHLSPALAAAHHKAAEEGRHRTLLDRIEDLVDTIDGVMTGAKEEGKSGAILAAARELRAGLELLGKATGELKPDGVHVTFNIATNPEWLEVQRRLLSALGPFPEARIAVAEALDVVSHETKELGP